MADIAEEKNEVISVVGAVIINKKGEVLCAQRGEKSDLSFSWEFPGGKVKKGESCEDALIREIKEELNCTIKEHQKITFTTFKYSTIEIELSTFWCTLLDENNSPECLEHHTIRWCLKDELLELNWAPADLPTVEHVVQRLEELQLKSKA